jgi:hypothetical protein
MRNRITRSRKSRSCAESVVADCVDVAARDSREANCTTGFGIGCVGAMGFGGSECASFGAAAAGLAAAAGFAATCFAAAAGLAAAAGFAATCFAGACAGFAAAGVAAGACFAGAGFAAAFFTDPCFGGAGFAELFAARTGVTDFFAGLGMVAARVDRFFPQSRGYGMWQFVFGD